MDFIARTEGRLIVSCQAATDSPLSGPRFMAAMARAAELAGAAAVRVNGPEDIRAVRDAVKIPIIGIYKRPDKDSRVYITPSMDEVEAVYEAGADVVAVDGTLRSRRYGPPPDVLIPAIHDRFPGAIVMADVATFDEGRAAEACGADIIATTLSGYTDESRGGNGPDIELISTLASFVHVPVIAEGRFATPEEVRTAFEAGAHGVVVGTAITNPMAIAMRFVAASPGQGKRRGLGS